MRRLAIVAAVVSWLAQAAETWHGGPYVVNVSQRAATVAWIVPSPEVRLGLQPDLLTETPAVLRAEKVSFSALKPATTYFYDVRELEEGKGQFKTAPDGEAAFTFVVYGDTRTRHDVHTRVVEAILRSEFDFLIHTGDLVAEGNDAALWPIFFSIERELLRKAAIFAVLGNHERNTGMFYDFFDLRKPYYSFDWGGARFIMLDSDISTLAPTSEGREAGWADQVRWLEQELAASEKAAWRFVILHHPPFSAVKSRQDGNQQVKALIPLFEKYRVTAVFSGHDHNYQRHFRDGVHYIVTGGGGAPLYVVDGPIEGITQKAESIENFVLIKVTGERAQLEALDLNGRLLDTVELTAASSGDRQPAIWVDVASQSAAEDGSEAFPFKSITKALGAAQPGTVVRVKAGEYRENIVLGDGLSLVGEGLPVLRAADTSGPVVVMRGKTVLDSFRVTGGADGIIVDVNTDARIVNCEIVDNSDDGIGFERAAKPGDTPATVHIENCLVSGNADGIDL